MKPKNFPGRKNEKRKRALAQLKKAANTKADRLDRAPGFSRAREIERLEAKIMPESVARAVRTKKDRSGRAKLRQAA
jgi:hypothetical protein